MASVKDNIVSLEVVYKSLNTTIDKNIELLKEGASAVDAYNKKISVVPSAYKNGLESLSVTLEKVKQSEIELTKAEKEKANAIVKLNQVQRSQNQTEISNLRTKTQTILLKDREQKLLEKEQQKLNASLNIYNKTQQQLNKVQQAYNNLAVKKERYNNLTAYEEVRLKTLQAVTEKYNTTLKAVDATVGKHTRNVGNYASGFNPLNNSINQLTREMPAFTYSVQTGFMALSNNIPIFTDAISQAVRQNKELISKGEPTTSVLSQLAGAFFSWGTALSVAITLTTVYGKEIGEFIKNIGSAGKSVQSISDQLNSLSEARANASELASKEISELDTLYKTATNVTLSINDRKKAVDKLQELYPKYLSNINDENILNGKAENQYYKLRDAIIAKYTAQAIGDKLAENSRDRLEDYMDLQQKLVNAERNLRTELNANNAYRKKYVETDINGKVLSIKKGYEELGALRLLKNAIFERDKAEMELTNHKKEALKEDSLLISTQQKLLNQSKDLIINKEKDTKKTKANTKAKQEQKKVNADLYSKEWFTNAIKVLQKEQDLTASMSPKYELLQKQINLLKIAYESLYGTKKKFNEETQKENINLKDSDFVKDLEKAKELLKWNEDFKKSFSDDFINQSGFDKIFDLIENFDKLKVDGVSTALAISEAFQQAFNTINNASQNNFDAEYARLEEQKDFSIQMAGGSATAKEEIEKQYEERKKAIQRREAEAQKKLALFNILINTAQAVVSALPNIPLSIAIGVIGAVQAGIVASQQIPQFWKGTENAPEGLAWTQEKGAEVITDKGGNVKTLGSNKGAQLTYLNKGDKVYKSHEDYINKVLNKNGIDELGSYMNFAPKTEIINNGITKADLEQNFSKLANVIKSKDGVSISIDEKGFRKKQGSNEFINSRLNLKSRQV